MKEVIIRRSRGKTLVFSLLSILMTLAAAFVFYMGCVERSGFDIFIGFIGFSLFGYAMVFITGQTFSTWKNPNDDFVVKINDEGINDRSTVFTVGLIKWEEIESVKITRVFSEKFVSITLVDEDAFFSARPQNNNLFFKLNRRFFDPINITLQMTTTTPEALLEMIVKKRSS